MSVNDLGAIAERAFEEMEHHYADVKIGDFIVMPDHVHFLVNVGPSSSATLPRVVSAYKSMVLRRCAAWGDANGITIGRLWQRNYYETIVRSSAHYEEIRAYMWKNPARWAAAGK